MFDLLSFALAFLISAPAFVGLYLLVVSADTLAIRYQNFMLEMTHEPLKDEDFPHLYRIVWGIKAAGGALFCGGLAGVLLYLGMI